MINRQRFFDDIRQSPFKGLNQSQVDGMEAILDLWEKSKFVDLRKLAYMLATTFHETAQTMKPIKEYGSEAYLKSKKYYPWYGRGYVQLTWEDNYKRYREEVKKLYGVDIVANPDNALIHDVAAYVMFDGMYRGRFTGKGLPEYFNDTKTDWVNARQIINRMDKAQEIASIAKQFYADLVNASSESLPSKSS